MDADFWHERWARGEIGFHQQDFNAHMLAFIDRLEAPRGAHVLVPLCGKSRDMLWLLQHGFRVTGIEISATAAESFFSENGLPPPRVTPFPGGRILAADRLQIFCADFFTIDPGRMPLVDAVYDRAALVAMPPGMRKPYADHLLRWITAGARTLLITLEYPQQEMQGPPFAVTPTEVDTLFGAACRIELLHSEDCLAREPRFRSKGLTHLVESVFLLQRNR